MRLDGTLASTRRLRSSYVAAAVDMVVAGRAASVDGQKAVAVQTEIATRRLVRIGGPESQSMQSQSRESVGVFGSAGNRAASSSSSSSSGGGGPRTLKSVDLLKRY